MLPMPSPVNSSWKRDIQPRARPQAGEVDAAIEDDVAVVVSHDVVAVQAVAVLVEIVLALGAVKPLMA